MNIYLAGKIEKNCWRHSIADQDVAEKKEKYWSPRKSYFPGIFITGPFFKEGCDHGCAHGNMSHGQAQHYCNDEQHELSKVEWETEVRVKCLDAIKKSDAFFVWIDDLTCYATLIEAGYAFSSNKKIFTAVSLNIEEQIIGETRGGSHELWFLKSISEKFDFFSSPIKAFQYYFS